MKIQFLWGVFSSKIGELKVDYKDVPHLYDDDLQTLVSYDALNNSISNVPLTVPLLTCLHKENAWQVAVLHSWMKSYVKNCIPNSIEIRNIICKVNKF